MVRSPNQADDQTHQFDIHPGRSLNLNSGYVDIALMKGCDDEQQLLQTFYSGSSSSSNSYGVEFNGRTFEDVKAINQQHQNDVVSDNTFEYLLEQAVYFNAADSIGMVSQQEQQQQAEWLQLQMKAVATEQREQEMYERSTVLELEYPEEKMGMGMHSMAGSSDLKLWQEEAMEKKRKYMMEKNIERKEKRKIKNRESAARSRARKQAYTNQLEHEVTRLRATNERLKKEKVRSQSFTKTLKMKPNAVKIVELYKNTEKQQMMNDYNRDLVLQELEMHLRTADLNALPRYQLRRTHSSSF